MHRARIGTCASVIGLGGACAGGCIPKGVASGAWCALVSTIWRGSCLPGTGKWITVVFNDFTGVVGRIGVAADECPMGASVRKLVFRRKNIEKAS